MTSPGDVDAQQFWGLIEAALRQLDNPVATGANEVVMVALAAEPVASLGGIVRERVDDPVLGQRAERPVDGREADSLAAGAQAAVELLRGDVVRLARELVEHPQPLPRHA